MNADNAGNRKLFHTDLYVHMRVQGQGELPRLEPCSAFPNDIVPFEKARARGGADAWVHFYEPDDAFRCVLNDPWRYLGLFQNCNGIVMPDCSVLDQLPLWKQKAAVGEAMSVAWFYWNQGLRVLPNARWGLEATFGFAIDPLPAGSVVAVSTYGCRRDPAERAIFARGFRHLLDIVRPTGLVVHSRLPGPLELLARSRGIEVRSYPAWTERKHPKKGA